MAETPPLMDLRVMSPVAWVQEEMNRQIAKRGQQNHNPFKYFTILAEEFGEVARVLEQETEGKYPNKDEYHRQLEYELIQTAAVALAFVSAIRRGKGTSESPVCVCDDCVLGEVK